MKLHRLTQSQHIERPRDEVFRFFADPRNLEPLTPPWLRFHFVGEPPAELGVDSMLDYRIRLYGVPVGWRARIDVWEPPDRFVDVQVSGPYAYWHHTHSFKEDPAGTGTIMDDEVDYAMPLGPIGEIARMFFVGPSLRRIFAYRKARVGEIF